MRSSWRRAVLATLALTMAGLMALPALANAQDRPRISSFYVRDEGNNIRLRAAWCDQSPGVVYAVTFRIFNSRGNLVRTRVVRGEVTRVCNTSFARVPDVFPNGQYRANAEVRNLRSDAFVRNRSVPFIISG